MATVRTFIANELSEDLLQALDLLQDGLRSQMPRGTVRWVRPDGIHLTLKFLGDTPVDQVDQVKAALAEAAAKVGPFRVAARGLGCFPNTRRPRVIWVGLEEPTGALRRLRDAVEAHVAPLGFPTEGRSFNPHLTLGRVQRNASSSEVREVGQRVAASTTGLVGEMEVSTVSYIKSELRPSGAVYTTLLDAALKEEKR
jgi:2'-5' RNA ligase